MKFRSSITGLVVFLLLVGIASAGVLGHYGLIEGTAKVSPPTFYAHSEKTDGYYEYKANVPADGKVKIFERTTYPEETAKLDGAYYDMPIGSFYDSTWNFYYRVRVEDNKDKAQFFTKVKFLDSNGNELKVIECPKTEFTSSTEFVTLNKTCEIVPPSDSARMTVTYFYHIKGGEQGVNVYLKVDEPEWRKHEGSRIEVSV